MRSILLVCLFVLGCGSAVSADGEISAEELLALPKDGVVLLDVRTPGEYAAGHVAGAVNIPHDALADRIGELPEPGGAPVVVYCKSGKRAGKGSKKAKKARTKSPDKAKKRSKKRRNKAKRSQAPAE